MDTFAEIADERRRLADLLSGLTGEQQAARSLCDQWSVHEVAAHLIVPLEVSTPRFGLTMLASRGSFDRANVRLARQQARRPLAEIVQILRHKAEARFTPPGAGPEAPLTDLLVHGLDIRWPLRLARDVPRERRWTALTFLTGPRARGLVPKGALDGLRFEADDLDWAHGSGPTVRGEAEALLLAITGRTAALAHLSGGHPHARHRDAPDLRRRARAPPPGTVRPPAPVRITSRITSVGDPPPRPGSLRSASRDARRAEPERSRT